jgi:hypothetical protein
MKMKLLYIIVNQAYIAICIFNEFMKLITALMFVFLLVNNSHAKDYLITDYGAKGDGKILCTSFIQSAINNASKEGGGRVVIPKGEFVSGTIFMKSNVEIYLKRGARLVGSINPEDYIKVGKWKALVIAYDVSNIRLSGKGTIDGRGNKLALKIDSLFYAGLIDSLDYNLVEKRPKWYLRPLLIQFLECNNIAIKDITLKNSSCWVQSYELCNNLVINNIEVDSDTYWNNDGIDIMDCKNVEISHCDINAADDGICIKSEDWTRERYCDSIFIHHCKVRSSASAIKLGTSSVSHMRNITVRHIKVYDTYRSAIAIEAMQGGIIENVLVEDIKATNTGNAIFLRVGQIRGAKYPGTLKNVILRRIKVQIPFSRPDQSYNIRGPSLPFFHNTFPSSITGIIGHPIESVLLEDIKIIYPGRGNAAYANLPVHRISDVPEVPKKYPEFSMFGELPAWGFYVRHVEGLQMKNVVLKLKKADYRPAIVFDDVDGLKLEALKVKGDKKKIFRNNVRAFEEK